MTEISAPRRRRRFAAWCAVIFAVPAASVAAPLCPGQKDCAVPAPEVRADAALPPYRPTEMLTGTLKIFGSDMNGQVDAWISAFRKVQPKVTFQTRFPSSDGAVAGLVGADADIGSAGREAMLSEHLAFQETFGYDLYEAPVASGSFNGRGKTPSVVIYVHKDNPLTHLTVDQLDGIFGSMRTGGYEGFYWRTDRGRGADKDIRTWGQLGLTGAWAAMPIRPYGYALSGMGEFFERKVLKGGNKWHPDYQQVVESFSKMVPNGDFGPGSSLYMLDQVRQNKGAIAWSFLPMENRMQSGELKQIAIGTDPAGPFYLPDLENTLSRKYPLTRSVFFYLKNDPKEGLIPLVREFLRFVYSRDGQQAVAAHKSYLPLPAEEAGRQLARAIGPGGAAVAQAK